MVSTPGSVITSVYLHKHAAEANPGAITTVIKPSTRRKACRIHGRFCGGVTYRVLGLRPVKVSAGSALA